MAQSNPSQEGYSRRKRVPCSFCCCNQTTHPPACVCPQPAGVLYRAGRGHCPQPAGKGTCHPPGPALKRGRRAAGKRGSDCSRLLLQRGEEREAGSWSQQLRAAYLHLASRAGDRAEGEHLPSPRPMGPPGRLSPAPPAPRPAWRA